MIRPPHARLPLLTIYKPDTSQDWFPSTAAVPPDGPGCPVCASASRLFDYEWSMLCQQNAQRAMSDTEQRVSSDLL